MPVDVIVKIKTRFLRHVEHQCAELGLSVNEEKQWIPDLDLLDKMDLSDSVEESEDAKAEDVHVLLTMILHLLICISHCTLNFWFYLIRL